MRIQRVLWAGALAAMASAAGMASAQTLTLYDASSGTTPGAGGQLAFGNTGATETYVSQVANPSGPFTNVNSAASTNIYAGYANYTLLGTPVNAAFPTLNSAAGFALNFTVQNAGDSTTYNAGHPRSALSVILLDSNHTGVEIGIRPDLLFTQATDFNSASKTYNATAPGAALTAYSLAITGTTYTLTSGATTLLTGTTTQYTASGDLAAAVYLRNNFVFVGDDTTSDGGTYNLKALSITANAATPEPSALPLTALGAVGMAFVACRRAQARRQRGSTIVSG